MRGASHAEHAERQESAGIGEEPAPSPWMLELRTAIEHSSLSTKPDKRVSFAGCFTTSFVLGASPQQAASDELAVDLGRSAFDRSALGAEISLCPLAGPQLLVSAN